MLYLALAFALAASKNALPVAPVLPAAANQIAQACEQTLGYQEREFLAQWSEPLALLPLDSLLAAEFTETSLTLRFDFGKKAYREVKLAGKQSLALKRSKGGFDLVKGKPVRIESDGRTLRVAREVRFEIDLQGGIRSVRGGDLKVDTFIGCFDLELSAAIGQPRLALDGDGRLMLQTAEDGSALRIDGQLVPEAYDRWLRIECKGRVIECGLGQALDGRVLNAAG